MASDKTRVNDGFTSLEGGMDGGSATNLLPRNKYYFGMNATARTGYVNNRPGWFKHNLIFSSGDDETLYTTGRFQGSSWYLPDDGIPIGIASVSGHIFTLTVGANGTQVADLTPSGDPNMSTLPRVWMQQADKFMVIQDGIDAPFVFDGAGLRRSKQGPPSIPNGLLAANDFVNYEVPTGTAMAYGQGRLWIVRGKNFEAGDIIDGAIENSAIRFSEVVTLKDSFSVPITSGDITAILFSANLDTSLGQGELQVHTASGEVTTLLVTTDRSSWTTSSIQRIALKASGSVSQDATVPINGDTWYRSLDGIRSFIVARREFGTWGNTPESREINTVLSYDTDYLIQYASGVWFDNRLLITISPQQVAGTIYFQGLSVLDFDLLSALATGSFNNSTNPAYDGVWAGLNICKITRTVFGSVERCFLFTWDSINGNGLWELSKQEPFDDGTCPIASYIETGSYNFNNLTNPKKLLAADLWIDQLKGTTTFDFKWLPEQYPFWQNWQSFSESDGGVCYTTDPLTNRVTCQTPVQVPLQYRSRLRLQEPDYQDANPQVDYPFNFGYDFRFRIAWIGRARLKGFRVHAYLEEDETTGVAP